MAHNNKNEILEVESEELTRDAFLSYKSDSVANDDAPDIFDVCYESREVFGCF